MNLTPEAIRAQIAVGVQTYENHLDCKPKGIWLPECAYIPSLDTILKQFGIEYIITESHGLMYATHHANLYSLHLKWGYKGYNEVWLNSSNDWIYRHLHNSSELMIELANENQIAEGIKKDALNQAARELLLAQSSDWAFIMKTGTMVPYAEKRTKDHMGRFSRLYHDIKENNIDEGWLRDVQYKYNIFPEIDYKAYSSV